MGKREMPAKEHRTQRRPQDSRKSQDNRRPRDSRRMQDSRKPQGNRRPEKSREELEEVYYNPAKSMAGDRSCLLYTSSINTIYKQDDKVVCFYTASAVRINERKKDEQSKDY